jgi:hypothetical protein
MAAANATWLWSRSKNESLSGALIFVRLIFRQTRYALCANAKVRSRIMFPEPCRHWHEKYPQGVVASHVSALAGLWAAQDISSYASRKGFVIRCPLANIFAHSSVAQR